MDKIYDILRKNNYNKKNNKFSKNKKKYISQIELNYINDKYIEFKIGRIYFYNQKRYKMLNERRKITKLIGKLQSIIDNESKSICEIEHIYHCEMYCEFCEDKIIEFINKSLINRFSGAIGLHNTEHGRCLMVFDKKTVEDVIKYYKEIQFCKKCYIEVLHDYNSIYFNGN